jgi:hypothetical protein
MAKELPSKAGVKSSAKKQHTSRYGFDPHPAAGPVPGASGQEPRRRRQEPGTATARAGKAAALRGQKGG